MIDFKQFLNRKEKNPNDLARDRLEKELTNSTAVAIISFCALGLTWSLMVLLGAKTAKTKIYSVIISVLLITVIVFLEIIHQRRKNAMIGILEAFLGGERNVSNIAMEIRMDNKTTAKLIQTMMFKKIIIDASIDIPNNQIVDRKKSTDSMENIGKIVACRGCGASNTLDGTVGQRCEYCGALIDEEMLNEKN